MNNEEFIWLDERPSLFIKDRFFASWTLLRASSRFVKSAKRICKYSFCGIEGAKQCCNAKFGGKLR